MYEIGDVMRYLESYGGFLTFDRLCQGTRLDYYDIWFPNLSPSAELLRVAGELSWDSFRRKFRREMSEPYRSRALDVLAALSHQPNLSLGC